MNAVSCLKCTRLHRGVAWLARELLAAECYCCPCRLPPARLGRELGDQVLLVVAEEGGEPVAAALNLVGSHCLYGRNWGCAPGKDYR